MKIYLKNIIVFPSESFQNSEVPGYFSFEKSRTLSQEIVCWLGEARIFQGQPCQLEDIFPVDQHPGHQGGLAQGPQLVHHVPDQEEDES